MYHVVPAPRDRRIKKIRQWLVENVGGVGEDWSIAVDMEIVEFFSRKINERGTDELPREDVFVIRFKKEEDKVKFILSFL